MNGAEPKIGVIGAGAWGTALAHMLAREGRAVWLWARAADLARTINQTRRNEPYLPGIALSPTIRATARLADLEDCAVALLATPAQHLAPTLGGMRRFPADLVLCAKGIEAKTDRLMHQVAGRAAPRSALAVLSGPTFAGEVAAGLPAAVTLACGGGRAQWARLAPLIARETFRPYYSDDLTGAEVGGAVKNVLAIACGVAAGLGLGQNARSALITRGFAEMVRFGQALGARAETLAGLCGLGDLVLTCSSASSRNFALGQALGEGAAPEALLNDRRTVAEGAHTAPVLHALAQKHEVAMPIVAAVARLLKGGSAPLMLRELLARPLGAEGPAGLEGAAKPDGHEGRAR